MCVWLQYLSWPFLEIGRTTKSSTSMVNMKGNQPFWDTAVLFSSQDCPLPFLIAFVVCINALRANLHHDADDESPT